jgi:O-antigen ligase/tetratricopeptide (TPR) repeat protein
MTTNIINIFEKKFDAFLLRTIKFGLLTVPFIPLIFSRNTFSVFNFSKAIVFRIIVEVLIVLFVIFILRKPEYRPWIYMRRWDIPTLIFSSLSLFILSYAISAFAGIDWFKSFWGEWERMGGLFTLLHYYIFFVIAISIFRNKEDWHELLWFSVIAAVLASVYGFLQRFNLFYVVGASTRLRILGTLGNPAALAGYLIFNLYFAFYLTTIAKKKIERLFLFTSIAIFIIAIVMTGVRGAVLALFISGLVILISIIRTWKDQQKIIKPKTAIIIVFIFAIILLGILGDPSLERLRTFSLESGTIKERLLIWSFSFDGFMENPIFGWGPEHFESLFSKLYNPELYNEGGTVIFDRAHNIFLDILTTQGIIGLGVFVFLWSILIRAVWKLQSIKSRTIFMALIFAYLIHMFFFFDLVSTYIMLMLFMGFMYAMHKKNEHINKKSFTHVKGVYQGLIAVSLAVIMVTLIIYTNVLPYFANKEAARGFVAFDTIRKVASKEEAVASYEQGVEHFNYALQKGYWTRNSIARKFSEAYVDSMLGLNGALLQETKKDGYMLVDELERHQERLPTEFASWIYAYKTKRVLAIYDNTLLFDEMEKTHKQALGMFPHVVELYYDAADTADHQRKYESVISFLKQAYNLNTEIRQSAYKLGKSYILYNEDKKGEGFTLAINAMKSTIFPEEEVLEFGQLLERDQRYDDMIELFSLLDKKAPDRQYIIQLAYAYYLVEDIDTAQETINKAFLRPLNSQEIQQLVYISALIENK